MSGVHQYLDCGLLHRNGCVMAWGMLVGSSTDQCVCVGQVALNVARQRRTDDADHFKHTRSHALPRAPTGSHSLPLAPTRSHSLPRAPTRSHALPLAPTRSHSLPLAPTRSYSLPRAPTRSHSLPRAPTRSHVVGLDEWSPPVPRLWAPSSERVRYGLGNAGGVIDRPVCLCEAIGT